MALKRFLALLLILPVYAQTPSVSFRGVDLRLGMTKDAVLAKFTAKPEFKVSEIGTDSYMVMVKHFEDWEFVGGLIFRSGKLNRISLWQSETEDKQARTLVKAFYNAIASGEKVLDVWTATNDNAVNPAYSVHVLFKDREVVLETISYRDFEGASVKTYFPRMLFKDKTP